MKKKNLKYVFSNIALSHLQMYSDTETVVTGVFEYNTGAMELRNLHSFIGALWAPANLMLLPNAVTTTAFRLLRLVFRVFQTVYWQLNGTAKQLREAHLPENYDRSAQVLDVLLSYEFCPIGLKRMENFICTHNRFESPQYVLDNDHINLMFITDMHAVFCEPIGKGMLL